MLVLVEDEALVRMFAADFLDEAGFKVFEACNANEALQLLQARPDVQVLMTDVEMGKDKMNGFELARKVQEQWPGVMILIVSGRAEPGAHDVPAGAAFISKPYQPASVVRTVQDMLARQIEPGSQR